MGLGGNENVKAFAVEQIHELDKLISQENQSVTGLIASRKLQYGEKLDDDET